MLHLWLVLAACLSGCATGQWTDFLFAPEERTIRVRDPYQLARVPIPELPPPATVTSPQDEAAPWHVSLDDAIRIALENSEVIRVLTGLAAASSGRTVYDAAITQTSVEQEKAVFDPVLDVDNTFSRSEVPQARFDPDDPFNTLIDGTRTDGYDLNLDVTKKTLLGGTFNLGYDPSVRRFSPGEFPLNPQTRSALETSYVQPLLQGAGVAVNRAPILLARINTERSFFQFKESVQGLVQGVIESYWSLVRARTEVWARRQQIDQGSAALERAEARRRRGLGDVGDVAQTRLALANFRANLISAEADLLQREAALRNILGLPPAEGGRVIPTTPPTTVKVEFDWNALLEIAEVHRPDIIELKLILEADEQQLIVARNQALPSLGAVALYRWNGLEGTAPSGDRVGTDFGDFTDWTLGVNFSVPIGLRAGRAGVRQRELIIARDRAHLQQGLQARLIRWPSASATSTSSTLSTSPFRRRAKPRGSTSNSSSRSTAWAAQSFSMCSRQLPIGGMPSVPRRNR